MVDRTIGMTASLGDAAPGDRADRGTVFLSTEEHALVDLARVPAVLEAGDWLGEEIDRDEHGTRRFATDLVLGVGSERPVTFRRSMIVSLGPVGRQADGWTIPIEWQAAALTPLFPVFVGRVRVGAERVAIDGHYAPPFGLLGVALDRAVLGVAARATAKVILTRFVRAMPHT